MIPAVLWLLWGQALWLLGWLKAISLWVWSLKMLGAWLVGRTKD